MSNRTPYYSILDPAKVADEISKTGFWGPFSLLGPDGAAALLAHMRSPDFPKADVWSKDVVAKDRAFIELAHDPRLRPVLEAYLGPDVILWGVLLNHRIPGQRHRWHCDAESSTPEGGFLSLWIGLEHTSADSSLHMASGSHRFGHTIQEQAYDKGLKPDDIDEKTIEAWVGTLGGGPIVRPKMGDGDAILFDGRAWHGTHNTQSRHARTAVLIQFARADRPVRILKKNWDWPFQFKEDVRPPVVAVSGTADPSVNLVEDAPSAPEFADMAVGWTRQLDLPLARGGPNGRTVYQLGRGRTGAVQAMSTHMSVLESGRCPHPPHSHNDEEILIVLDGKAEILLAQSEDDPAPDIRTMTRGDFAYYPARGFHTIRNPGPEPVTYLMFRWSHDLRRRDGGLQPLLVSKRADDHAPDTDDLKRNLLVFEGGTRWLKQLHCHKSYVRPGGGYAPHVDEHDVAIVMLKGRITVMGRTIGPSGVIWCPAGSLHGMDNLGDTEAEYLVFEFHPTRPSLKLLSERYARQAVRAAKAVLYDPLPAPAKTRIRAALKR